VSLSRYCVQLASEFANEDSNTTPDVVSAGAENNVPHTDADVPDDNTESQDEVLHSKERCTLEYFLAMIRMKSQKQLIHWSMLSPLAHHSKGYMQPGRKNPLCGSQCTVKTAWKKLDGIFEECTPVLMHRIKQQFTCSAAFDNWQRSITKMWQGGGKASVFQRGTAFFIKQDKAFLLPVGTIMQSPHGVLFMVTSCISETIYTCVITGDLLPSNYVIPEATSPTTHNNVSTAASNSESTNGPNVNINNGPNVNINTASNSDTNLEADDESKNKESDGNLIVDGGVYWPRIGWEVKYVPEFDPCKDITYVDQHVPSPLCTRVLNDSPKKEFYNRDNLE